MARCGSENVYTTFIVYIIKYVCLYLHYARYCSKNDINLKSLLLVTTYKTMDTV